MPPNFDKKKRARALLVNSKRWKRMQAALQEPDDFVTEDWLRSMGFRPADKYSPTAWAGGYNLACRLSGARWMIWNSKTHHVVVGTSDELSMSGPPLGWKAKMEARARTLGQLTRHGILFILKMAYLQGRKP
jgi:hypothetical protein